MWLFFMSEIPLYRSRTKGAQGKHNDAVVLDPRP